MMFSFLLLSFVAYLPLSGGIAVMSIDLGSEWLKIGIVKPGVPMEIALNTESKRKTPFVVSMKGDERLFGDPAMMVAVKQPPKAFIYLSHLIGKKFESPAVEVYKKRFPYYKLLKDEERGTVLFEGEDNVNYSVEELIAMVLNNSKNIAENFASHKMKDIVLTVPSYFKQAERRCLILAAKMVGLNVLQLINDNTAVALNYGIFRSATFNSTIKHIMFYDMGASHTTVTIVGYSTTKVKDRGYAETVPQLSVKGVGFDTTLGGLEMDMRLRDHLVKGFKEKYSTLKSDITKNPRAMAKLLKEARRVRQILSPNTDTLAQIENLFEEKDFKMKVTRTDFETLCADLFDLVHKPIKMAFDASSMSKDDIDTVILMGGGTRIPKVQEVLTKFIGKEELGKSINTDEAGALGAVYKAASLMAGFKVKRFIVKDLNMYPVDVQFERSSSTEEAPRQINRNLYHRLNPLPQKKIMTFNRKLTDFNFNISYGDLTFLTKEQKANLMDEIKFAHVKLSGVADAHTKNVNGNPKGVKAYYHLDESGLLNIEKVEAHFEKTPEAIKEEESTLSKISSKISDFFGSLKAEEPDVKSEEAPSEKTSSDKGTEGSEGAEAKEKEKEKKTAESGDAEKGSAPKTANDTAGNTTTGGNETEKAKPAENVVVTEAIQFEIKNIDLPDLTTVKFDESVKKLKALEARDQAKKALEKARNNLESFISENREKMEDEEVQKISTTEEREKIGKDLTDAYNWFDEDGWDADETTLKKKLKGLKEAVKEINARISEAKERPKAIEAMLQSLNMSNLFSTAMLAVPDAKEIYSEKDLKDLEKIQTDTKTWFMTTWRKQNETSLDKNPVMLTKDIYSHQGKLDREIAYLVNKAKYYVPKPKPKNETVSNTTSSKTPKQEANTTATEGANKTENATTEEKAKASPPPSEEEKVETIVPPEVIIEGPGESGDKKKETPDASAEKVEDATPKGKESADDTSKTVDTDTSDKKVPKENEEVKLPPVSGEEDLKAPKQVDEL